MNRDIYAEVTERIVKELENGAAPWVKPWRRVGGSNMPHNAVTRRPYSGVNVLLLWMTSAAAGYASQGWMTFNQVKESGGHVRKGEKATLVVFVKPLTVKEKDGSGNIVKNANGDDAEKQIQMLRGYYVFNVAQCDDLPAKITAAGDVIVDVPSDAEFDAWVQATGAIVRHGGDRAAYSPSLDSIVMPPRAAFNEQAGYSATMLHELGHWTGHKTRLARSLRGRFGDSEYAAEELIAELTSAYLCAEKGIDGELRHAGYIDHWLKLLKSDKRAIFTAAAAASKAATYLNDAAVTVKQIAA